MKKKIALGLALALAASVGTTAFAAAANPFTDVPAKHWSYNAIQQLSKAGIVDGYNDGQFKGDKTITRYEMAVIVAKAMAKEDKANAQQKAMIDKLAAEFSSELANLGVRVDKLEKNSSSVKITGYDRQRYQTNDALSGFSSGPNGTSAKQAYRMMNDVKLFVTGHINDTMDFTGATYFRVQDSDAGTNDSTREGDVGFYNAFVTMKDILPSSSLQMGRLHVQVGNGMLFGGDYFDGGQFNFGNNQQLQGFVGYGDYTYMPGPDFFTNTTNTTTPAKAKIAQLQYNFSKTTSLYAGYMASANNVLENQGTSSVSATLPGVLFKDYDLGFTTNLTPNLQLYGDYAKNSDSTVSNLASGDKTAWFTCLKLGAADATKPGSSDIYAKYFKRGAAAIDWRASFNQFNPTFNQGTNIEGPTVGYDLTVAPNATLNLEYAKYHQYSTATNSGSKNYDSFLQAALVFTF